MPTSSRRTQASPVQGEVARSAEGVDHHPRPLSRASPDSSPLRRGAVMCPVIANQPAGWCVNPSPLKKGSAADTRGASIIRFFYSSVKFTALSNSSSTSLPGFLLSRETTTAATVLAKKAGMIS